MGKVIDMESVLRHDESVFVIVLRDKIEEASTNEERQRYLVQARKKFPEIKNGFYRKMLEKTIEKYSVY